MHDKYELNQKLASMRTLLLSLAIRPIEIQDAQARADFVRAAEETYKAIEVFSQARVKEEIRARQLLLTAAGKLTEMQAALPKADPEVVEQQLYAAQILMPALDELHATVDGLSEKGKAPAA